MRAVDNPIFSTRPITESFCFLACVSLFCYSVGWIKYLTCEACFYASSIRIDKPSGHRHTAAYAAADFLLSLMKNH